MANVLIVDDDENFAVALGRVVREAGHACEFAADGHDGLAKYADGHHDLVIADLKMPRVNGIEFIRELKRMNRDAAVIVVTGYADLETAVDAMHLGACDYLEKPLPVEMFRSALERGLEQRQEGAQLDFVRGAIWMVVLATPLWLAIGILSASVSPW